MSGKNQIIAINGFAVPALCYTAGIINLTVNDCAELDRFKRKQITLFKALHPRADVNRLYVSCHCGGSGLLSISDIVHLGKSALLSYATKSKEPIMKKVKQ